MPKQSYYHRWWMTVNQVVFCQKWNTFSWNICSSYSLSYKPKVWCWNILIFYTIRIYCYRKLEWLSPFLLCNSIGELAMIHVIFRYVWRMVLHCYGVTFYITFGTNNHFVLKFSDFCIGDKCIKSSCSCA